VSALSNKINKLCTNNEQLKNQLNSAVSSLSEQAYKVSDASPSSFNAIDKYMDRERRKSNLIIYGLSETSTPTGSARQSADLNSIHKLVRSEFNVTNLETTRCFHLGKHTNKPIPLLIP